MIIFLLITASRNQSVSSFDWHSTNENRLLAVMYNGTLKDIHVLERISLVGCIIVCSLFSWFIAFNFYCFSFLVDLLCTMYCWQGNNQFIVIVYYYFLKDWSSCMSISWACGRKHSVINTSELSSEAGNDISVRIQQRALRGYGLHVRVAQFKFNLIHLFEPRYDITIVLKILVNGPV